MPMDQRTDVTHNRADHGSSQDDHDQRCGEVDEKDVDANALGVLQRNDKEKGYEEAHQPGAPVEWFLPLGHPVIVNECGRLKEAAAPTATYLIAGIWL